MKSSPRNFRLTDDGLNALKILEGQSPLASRAEIVSKALTAAAKGSLATPPVQFRLLDPKDYFSIQACLSEAESLHRQNRHALLKIRPTDKTTADKLTKAIESIDAETQALQALRLDLANLARTTETLSTEDRASLDALIDVLASAKEKGEEQGPFELGVRVLRSLIP